MLTRMETGSADSPFRAAIAASIMTGMTTVEEMAKVHNLEPETIERWLAELDPNGTEHVCA